MTDYQGNSKRAKAAEGLPEKRVERITTGEVLLQKPSVGKRLKSLFVAESFSTVRAHVIYDVMIPALKDMLWDALSQGSKRMIFGDRAINRSYRATHVSYQTPPQRTGYTSVVGAPRDNLDRRGLIPARSEIRGRSQVMNTGLVLSTRDEAERILEQMTNIVDQYGSVTVGDLYHMAGMPASHVDETWGWDDLTSADVEQIPEGYLLDLPRPQPLRER